MSHSELPMYIFTGGKYPDDTIKVKPYLNSNVLFACFEKLVHDRCGTLEHGNVKEAC